MTPDTLGWIGTAIMAVASIGVAHKQVWSIWAMLAGNIMFGISGHMIGLTSLVAVSAMMGVLDFYGIYRWSR